MSDLHRKGKEGCDEISWTAELSHFSLLDEVLRHIGEVPTMHGFMLGYNACASMCIPSGFSCELSCLPCLRQLRTCTARESSLRHHAGNVFITNHVCVTTSLHKHCRWRANTNEHSCSMAIHHVMLLLVPTDIEPLQGQSILRPNAHMGRVLA